MADNKLGSLAALLLQPQQSAPVTANPNMLAQALRSRNKPEFQMQPNTLQGLLDAGALATSPVPVLGDLIGIGADGYRFATDPSSRTPANFGLAALGLVPFLPPLMSAGLGRLAQSQGKTLTAPSMAGPGASQAGAVVYHGSPHKFDAFDSSKIGTGEGAQAYGHGLYLAENPAVAKEYSKLTPAGGPQPAPRRFFNGNELDAGSPEYHAAALLSRGKSVASVRKEVEGWINDSKNWSPQRLAQPSEQSVLAGWQKTLDTLNQVKSKSQFKTLDSTGNLYKVDLPDEAIAKMLDWDKPLSQQKNMLGSLLDDVEDVGKVAAEKIRVLASQPGLADWAKRDLLSDASQVANSKSPQHVAGVLKKMQLEYGINPESGPFMNVAPEFLSFVKGMQAVPNMDTGGGALSYLQARYGAGKAEDILREKGIPGIRYLDGGSRGAGQGTSNYVVFPGNENLLKILGRE